MNWGFSGLEISGNHMICDMFYLQTMVTHILFTVLGTWAAPLHEELHVLANPGFWGEGRTLFGSLSWHLGQCFGGIVHKPLAKWPLLKCEWFKLIFLVLCHVSHPNCMTRMNVLFLQCLDRGACRIEGIMETWRPWPASRVAPEHQTQYTCFESLGNLSAPGHQTRAFTYQHLHHITY